MSDWKKDLNDFYIDQNQRDQRNAQLRSEDQQAAQKYLTTEVIPAFSELKEELLKHGREVSIHKGSDFAVIKVSFEGRLELEYRVKTKGLRVSPETRFREKDSAQIYKSERHV